MKTSSNYGLKLMEGTDNVKRQDFVDNFTKIDTTMKTIADSGFPLVNATGTNAYTGTNTNIKSLTKGITKFTLFVGVDANGNCSLNLNSWGVKSIKDSFGNIVTNLKKDIPYNICYNGTDFILQGKGGGGNVQPSEVLNGKTFTNDKGPGVGTMSNNGSINATLNAGQSKTIPKGYTDGGTITVNSLASQTQATAGAGDILSGKTAIVNGNKVTGNMANNNNKTVDWCHFENITLQPHPTDSSQALVTVPMAVSPGSNSGYYGSGSKIQANIASLNASNIKAGVKVGRNDGSAGNCITGTFTSDATAQAGHILSGQSAYVNGNKVHGNIPVRGSGNDIANDYMLFNGEKLYLKPPNGNYFSGASVFASASQVANHLGITANKIVSGQEIAGVWGNATVESMGGKRFTSGTVNVGSAYHTVVNVGFNPNLIFTLHGNYISVTFNNLFGGNSLMVTNISRYNTGYRPSVTVEAPPTVAGKTTNATAFPVGNNSICVTMGVSGAYDVSYWALQI